MKKVSLSVIILCHRHDQRLVRAIKSAQFAKEVLVVDMSKGQIDWRKIEKKLAVKRIKNPLKENSELNFSQIRNLVVKKAKYDWVFFLDSDEVITAQSKPEVAKIVAQNQYSGALVERIDFFQGQPVKWGEVSRVWLLRLARKNSLKYLRPVHEVAQVSGNVLKSKIKLHHFAHSNIREFIDKVGLYASLEAKYRLKINEKFNLLEVMLNPLGKFLYNYFFKLGFMDGWRGLIYGLVMSLHSLLVRIHLYELNTTNDKRN